MLELQGKYTTAKVFTDLIDQPSISQIIEVCSQPMCEGTQVRIMPDVHAGAGCTVGTTMTIKDKIVPNLVGVDIGCGMLVIQIKETHIEPKKLDKVIRERVPSGFALRDKPHRFNESTDVEDLYCLKHVNPLRAEHSLGTLGGGNHFIEVDKDDEGDIYLVIHSGSRHLGLEVCNYYQNEAYRRLNQSSDSEIKELVAKMKAEGKHKQIEAEVKKLKNTKRTNVPKHLAYCEGDLFDAYVHDMKITQEFATLNRLAMADEIVKGMGWHVMDQFTTMHNYLNTDDMILRKGAVSAYEGEHLIIPMNMRDGSLLCIGKGNPDWNDSAPHGAGRLMSRSEAKQTFSMDEYRKSMGGIYTTSVNTGTIDECPMAYKPMQSIIDNISDTVEIVDIIKPIYNFKAGDE